MGCKYMIRHHQQAASAMPKNTRKRAEMGNKGGQGSYYLRRVSKDVSVRPLTRAKPCLGLLSVSNHFDGCLIEASITSTYEWKRTRLKNTTPEKAANTSAPNHLTTRIDQIPCPNSPDPPATVALHKGLDPSLHLRLPSLTAIPMRSRPSRLGV